MKKGTRAFRLTVFFVLLIAAWIFLAPFLAERLIVEKSLAHADAIVVLGGSSVYVERTQKASEIYKQGVAAKIVLTDDGGQTGWSRIEQRNIPYVEMAQRNLVAGGVPNGQIEIVKPAGSGTIYEAQILREEARAANWKSVLIVTSAYHTRRALWTFEQVFAADDVAIGIVAPPAGQQTPPPVYWWLTAQGWDVVAGEYVKSFYYWLYY